MAGSSSFQLVFVSVFACISAFLFGYDLGSVRIRSLPRCAVLSRSVFPTFSRYHVHPRAVLQIGPALPRIKESLATSDAVDEVIVGVAKLGAVAGAVLGAIVMEYGRKPAMVCDVLFFLAGPVVMFGFVGYANVALLITGRLLLGIGIGVSAVVVPAYLGEVSPAKYRGRVVGAYELMLCLGFLCASLVDALLDSLGASWMWMVGMPLLPATVMAMFVWRIPESPRWLVAEGRLDEALAVMKEIHGSSGNDELLVTVEHELLECWSSVQRELAPSGSIELGPIGVSRRNSSLRMTEDATTQGKDGKDGKDGKGGKENLDSGEGNPLLPPGTNASDIDGSAPHTAQRKLTLFQSIYRLSRGGERRAFWTVMALAFFNQSCASTAILNYAPVVFESQGVAAANASFFSAVTGFAKLLGVTVSFFLVDRMGRRPLLIWGSVGSAMSLLVVALADALASVSLMVSGMSLFIFFFSLSWAEVFWVIISEVFTMKAKSAGVAVCTATLFLVGSAADMLFLTIWNTLGFASFILYSTIALAGGAFVYLFLPETSGRSLAEVQEAFASVRL